MERNDLVSKMIDHLIIDAQQVYNYQLEQVKVLPISGDHGG